VQLNRWMGGKVNKQMSKKEWIKWISEQKSECMNEWMNEWMIIWANKLMDRWVED